jgi:hypothetical protein
MDAGRTLYLGGIPAAHASQEGVRAVLAQHGGGACVSRPFPSVDRSILTEIYLCHACSWQAMLRTETARQVAVGLQAQEAASDAATGGSYTGNNTDNHTDTSSRCVDRLDGTHRGVRSRLAWFARGIPSVVMAVWFTKEQ